MNTKKPMSFRELRDQIKKNAYYNFPNSFGEEGEDHINISIHSKTRIGKIFDPAYLKVINYRHIGKFNSVLNLWYWVRSPNLDDNIRRLTGYKLRSYVEKNGIFNSYVPNFKAIIGTATWLKVKSYPRILKEIKELDPEIKLLSYNVVKSSQLRICTNYAPLIIEIANIIIKAVKEDHEPDFSVLVDDESKAGLVYLEGVLSRYLTPEAIERIKVNEANGELSDDEYEEDYGMDNQEVEEESVENSSEEPPQSSKEELSNTTEEPTQ